MTTVAEKVKAASKKPAAKKGADAEGTEKKRSGGVRRPAADVLAKLEDQLAKMKERHREKETRLENQIAKKRTQIKPVVTKEEAAAVLAQGKSREDILVEIKRLQALAKAAEGVTEADIEAAKPSEDASEQPAE